MIKHGHARWKQPATPEYRVWAGMKQRCTNPNKKDWADYGGRGISVCPEWFNDFGRFLADVGFRPSSNHSLERKDNNGNYEPGNVKWATAQEQARNRRSPLVMVSHEGETMCVADWAKRLGVSPFTLYSRVKRYGTLFRPSHISANGITRKTHCYRGHEYTDENTYHDPSRPQRRFCRQCRTLLNRKFSKQEGK